MSRVTLAMAAVAICCGLVVLAIELLAAGVPLESVVSGKRT